MYFSLMYSFENTDPFFSRGSVGGGLTPQGAGVGVNAGFAQPNAPNFLTQYVPYYQAPAYGALAPASTVASYPTYTYTTTTY